MLQADVLVVAPTSLPPGVAGQVRKLPGVTAAQSVDAARIQVNGKYVAMLGVDPSAFRGFAARPTAASSRLWSNVAGGGVAVSYTMGRLDKLPLGGFVKVAGRRSERLRVGGFGTVGIPGVDAVVSAAVARSLGLPGGNAIVVSAPHARLSTLIAQIEATDPALAARGGRAAGDPGGGIRHSGQYRRGRRTRAGWVQRARAYRGADPQVPEGRGKQDRHALRLGRGRSPGV